MAADARGIFLVHAAGKKKKRPERKEREEVQGLTVAKALSTDGIEEVECLLYPGKGHVIITGAMVRDSSMQHALSAAACVMMRGHGPCVYVAVSLNVPISLFLLDRGDVGWALLQDSMKEQVEMAITCVRAQWRTWLVSQEINESVWTPTRDPTTMSYDVHVNLTHGKVCPCHIGSLKP